MVVRDENMHFSHNQCGLSVQIDIFFVYNSKLEHFRCQNLKRREEDEGGNLRSE